VNGSTINVDFFTGAIKHAQISSQISRRLGSVKALQSTATDLIETIADLTKQLEKWHESLPPYLKLKVGKRTAQPTPKTRFNHLMYLHNAFYGSLMAIHTIFTYPWISAFFGTEKTSAFRSQVSLSTNAVADAARNIILAVRSVEIDAASPHW
jgi:hypothetical protein